MNHVLLKRSLAGFGVALVLTACGGIENPPEPTEPAELEELQSLLITPTPEPTTDTLAAYVAKCEIATGIRIPDFSCNTGLSGSADPNGPNDANFAVVSQISSADNVKRDDAIGDGASGSRTHVGGDALKHQIQAAGGALAGVKDVFYFSSMHVGKNAKAEVKVTSLTTGASAMAGLMYRYPGGFDKDAANTLLAVAPNPGCSGTGCAKLVWQQRNATGADTVVSTTVTQLGGSAVALPIWLRLSFNNSGMVAQASRDHQTWLAVGSPLPSLNGEHEVGMAVASGTAVFENFMTSAKCDKPNVLSGNCEPDSTFQVLARTADAIAVANCRKGAETDPDLYNDIAVIQYNRTNGAICFYQSPTGDQTNGKTITAPSKGNQGTGIFPWVEPVATHQGSCTGCHDSGGLIRSPYLTQTGLLPKYNEGYNNDGQNALSYVGIDFADDRSWTVNPTTNDVCTSCHTLATNNVRQAGTAYKFAVMANSRFQTELGNEADGTDSRKNDVSVTSPTWMPYGGVLTSWPYNESSNPSPYLAAARQYQACSKAAWQEDPFNPQIHQEPGFVAPPVVNGCSFFPLGQAYGPPINNLNEYEIKTGEASTGSATGNLAAVTLTAAAKTDVYDPADNFYWLYKNQGGDGSAIVRVKKLTGGNEYAKAGLMFRNGYATGAVNVMLALTKDHGATFQYRATANGTTQTAYLNQTVDVDPETLSVWLRLDRTGRTFVGYISTNNRETWTQVAPPVTLVDLVTDFLGLVATSNITSTATASADFESFDWADRGGWTGLFNGHVLVDAKIASDNTALNGITTSRNEWITRETITTSSGDISGTADSCSYAFKTFGGPGHYETTVTSLTPPTGGTLNEFAKAGLMLRDNASAGAMNVFVGRTRDGITFQGRQTTGGTTTAYNLAVSGPMTFRLRRDTVNGQVVFSAAYRVNDAAEWTAWAQTFTFPSFISSNLAGLAVSSHGGPAATAVFNSGAPVEPPGLLWTSYDQPENNAWRDASVASTQALFKNTALNKTLSAAGTDIGGTTDQFEYAFQDLPGAATIQAKVTFPNDPAINALAKAGLMFRAKVGANSRNVMIALTKGNGATFQSRSTDGGSTSLSSYSGSGNSMWLKLVRNSSNQFLGYTSADGVAWTLVSSTTLSTMGSIAMVGLAVTSHDVTKPVTATFSNISVTLQAPPVPQTPCSAYCANPTTFTFGQNYQSGNLGTGALCLQTTRPVVGGNCGNFINGRTLSINGVAKPCNLQNWPSVPAAVNGGYCVQITPGNQSYAYFSLFN